MTTLEAHYKFCLIPELTSCWHSRLARHTRYVMLHPNSPILTQKRLSSYARMSRKYKK